MTFLDADQFARHLRDFEDSAWRFETQPRYTSPDELLDLYLAGEPKPEGDNKEWHDAVRSFVAAGKTIGRVRTVWRPFTDYVRYQFDWVIPENIQAGEDVRILDLTDNGLGFPDQDFWLFDDMTVVHLNFNPDGTLLNIEQLENPDLQQYRSWLDTALRRAVPFTSYARR